MQISITIDVSPDEEIRRLLDQGLDDYNAKHAGPDHAQDLWVIARNGNGMTLGGIKARTFYGWLFIDWLWVSPSARGSGIGTQMLRRAETEAQTRGCVGAYVDTFSFQAPEFYISKGYAEFGRIEDLPPGHACIWLRKKL